MKKIKYFLPLVLLTMAISCSDEDSDTVKEKIIPEQTSVKPGETLNDDTTKEETTTKEGVEEENVSEDTKEGVNPNADTVGVKYVEDVIIFEPEITTSTLGFWKLRKPGDSKYYNGGAIKPINNTYLEFTGNTKNGGTPKSPLQIKFTAPKTTQYRLIARMYQPLQPCEQTTPPNYHVCAANGYEPGDKRNDMWVRLEGDYEAGGTKLPKSILETDHKFVGRGVRQWGSLTAMEAHVDGKKTNAWATYKLKQGEQYTFTMSGRAQGCSIDYIMFYPTSNTEITLVQHDDPADKLPVKYRPDLLEQ